MTTEERLEKLERKIEKLQEELSEARRSMRTQEGVVVDEKGEVRAVEGKGKWGHAPGRPSILGSWQAGSSCKSCRRQGIAWRVHEPTPHGTWAPAVRTHLRKGAIQ
jgi:hypothetical protein